MAAEFPFLRYVVFFIAGILLYTLFPQISPTLSIALLLGVFIIYLILVGFNIFKNSYRFKFWIVIFAYLQLLLAGFVVKHNSDLTFQPRHISNLSTVQITGYLGLVVATDEQKSNSIANRLEVKKVLFGNKLVEAEGEVLIYHRSELQFGELVWIEGSPSLIEPPKNPAEFDYKKFMLRQGITHRHFVGSNFTVIGSLQENPIGSLFAAIRHNLMARLDSGVADPFANQIAKALLLGQKKLLEREISEAYATAGAMHILAVSGLHVGIIYGFFFLFVKPFRLKIKKRIIYLSAVILLIWCYAMLTGMSPSVLRAATMFTFMGIAQMHSRSPSIFNPIALSALVLLVFDPNLIYAVGFQLSYLALLGILVIQPLLVNLWLPNSKIIEYCWQITTVGIAAQLGTFALSAFYFHVFPTYFMLSNLIAIPGAFVIMSLGLPYLLLARVPFISGVLGYCLEFILYWFNFVIFKIQELPMAKFSSLSFEESEVFLYYLILFLVVALFLKPSKNWLYPLLILLFCHSAYRVVEMSNNVKESELTQYALQKGYALDYKIKNNLFTFDDAPASELSFKVEPNRLPYAVQKYPLFMVEKDNERVIVLPSHLAVSVPIDLDNENTVRRQWSEGRWGKEVNSLNGESAMQFLF